MGFLDKAKNAARKAVDQHGDKINDAADKAAELLDNKTDGKHTEKIADGKNKLEDAFDNLDGKNDDLPGRAP